MVTAEKAKFSHALEIARRFVAARRNAVALSDYPGPMPPDLVSAYQCQDAAIDLWPDTVVGWKIGKIPEAVQAEVGGHRLAGPIFAKGVHTALDADEIVCGVFVGGTACVEAEYVFEVGEDAPADKTEWSIADAAEIAGRLFVGVEMAGSPLSDINGRGPRVVISDFGNNADEILGVEIPGWRSLEWKDLTAETFIDGKLIGTGGALQIPGGPLESLQFIAENVAKRGRPLKKGMLISTGAATGVHDVLAGQKAHITFKGIQTIRVATVPRTAAR